MEEKKIKLDKFNITKNSKPLLIAEIGINHNGSLSLARKMLNKAVDCGADIVKFQTHLVEDEMLPSKNKKTGSHVKGSLFDILKKCSLTKKDHINLQRLCKKRKVMFLSTPFSKEAVDLLTSLKVSAFKIGSGETKNYHFIEYILKKNKPTLISTGTSSWEDLLKFEKKFRKYKKNIILMQCTSNYPTQNSDTNTGVVKLIREKLGFIPGYSDHSKENISSLAAAVMGAKVIERHFTLSRKLPGIDQSSSLEPQEFLDLRINIDKIYQTTGYDKIVNSESKNVINGFSQSIVTIKNIKKGEKLLPGKNIWYKRPGTGINANKLFKIKNKKTIKNLQKDQLLKLSDFKK